MALDYSQALSNVNPLQVAGGVMGMQRMGNEMQQQRAEQDRLTAFREGLIGLDTNDPQAVQAFMQQNPEYMQDIGTIANYGDAKQKELIGQSAVQLDQALESGDVNAALQVLEQNRGVIDGAGDPSFTTDSAIKLLQSNPERLKQLARGTAMASLGTDKYLAFTQSQPQQQKLTNIRTDDKGVTTGYNALTGQIEEVPTAEGVTRQGEKPQTVVNFSTKADGEQAKVIAKAEGDLYNQMRKDAVLANKSNASLDRLEKLTDKAFSGSMSGLKKDLSRLASNFGVNVEGLTETELFDALSNELTLGQTAKLTGVLTDKDMLFLQETVPQLSQTAEGRKKLIGVMRDINNATKEKAKLAAKFRKNNKGKFDSADFDEWLEGRDKKDLLSEYYQDEQPKLRAQAPQGAIDHLAANPGLAEQFKSKYGYLPGGM